MARRTVQLLVQSACRVGVNSYLCIHQFIQTTHTIAAQLVDRLCEDKADAIAKHCMQITLNTELYKRTLVSDIQILNYDHNYI
jgi:hypothetical protein